MRILHIAEPFATGVLNFLIDLTRQQVDTHEVYIAHGLRAETPQNVKALFDARVKLIPIKQMAHGVYGSVFNLSTYFVIKKVCEDVKPDIVHLHSSAAGFVGRLALAFSNAKLLYTPHGFSFISHGNISLRKRIYLLGEKIASKVPCRIVACSQSECEMALKLRGDSTFVNNGIDTSDLPEVTQSVNGFSVYTSGRIMSQKNPVLFNRIAAEFPAMNFEWIGDGNMAGALTSSNISVSGWLDKASALQETTRHNIFILPSLYEGLPIALLEAMYMGKICVVSNSVGNCDVIQDGVNGFRCDTIEDYVRVLKGITGGEYDTRNITRNAKNDVTVKYCAKAMFEAYEKVYENTKN